MERATGQASGCHAEGLVGLIILAAAGIWMMMTSATHRGAAVPAARTPSPGHRSPRTTDAPTPEPRRPRCTSRAA